MPNMLSIIQLVLVMHTLERDSSELPRLRLQDIEAHNHAINILKAKGRG